MKWKRRLAQVTASSVLYAIRGRLQESQRGQYLPKVAGCPVLMATRVPCWLLCLHVPAWRQAHCGTHGCVWQDDTILLLMRLASGEPVEPSVHMTCENTSPSRVLDANTLSAALAVNCAVGGSLAAFWFLFVLL